MRKFDCSGFNVEPSCMSIQPDLEILNVSGTKGFLEVVYVLGLLIDYCKSLQLIYI